MQHDFRFDAPTLFNRELTRSQCIVGITPKGVTRVPVTVAGSVPMRMDETRTSSLYKVTPSTEVYLLNNDSQRSMESAPLSTIRELMRAPRG